MSAQQLAAGNVQSIEQISAITPGLRLDNDATGSARSDRSKETLIIRGMAPTIGNQTTSVFINGVPLSDVTTSGIFDFDRVEVLKGPQSAYFGRETFAGAVNLITQEPTDTFKGYASALIASDNDYDVKAAFGGPIIPDLLSFRASARYFSQDGTWKNQAEPGHTLGDQSTRSGSLELKITPSDKLTVKLFGVYSNDDDGPGATAVLLPDQNNCTIGTSTRYFCGTLPKFGAGQPSTRTTITPGVTSMLQDYSTILSPDNSVDHFGMLRNTYHGSIAIDYELPHDIKLSSLTGFNRDEWSVLYNLNAMASPYVNPNPVTAAQGLANTDWPFDIQHKQQDVSQEFRIASGQNQRFRWLVGGSYLWTQAREGYSQQYFGSGVQNTIEGTTQSRTFGGFFGLAFDITKKLTLDFDGRYQSDALYSRDGTTGVLAYKATYNNFVPRVSLEFKPNKDLLLYATYSQGVNPGLGQDPLLQVPADYVEYLRSQGVSDGVKPEKLQNYEVGVKGKFLDGRLTFSGDVYYDIWTDKITEQTILIPRAGTTPVFVSVYTNLGKVDLWGIEAEMTAEPVNGLVLSLSGAINDSNIRQGACTFCETQTGNSNAKGNQIANTSKYTASATAEYSHGLDVLPDYKWYMRGEFFYKSGMYESDGNYAKSSPSKITNFRVGVRSHKMTVEAFVTNAFNNKAYTSLLPDWNLSNPGETYANYNSIYAGLPELRRFGVRVSRDF